MYLWMGGANRDKRRGGTYKDEDGNGNWIGERYLPGLEFLLVDWKDGRKWFSAYSVGTCNGGSQGLTVRVLL